MSTAFNPQKRSGQEASPAAAAPQPGSEQLPRIAPSRTPSLETLLNQYRDNGPVSSGVLVEKLLELHANYVESGVTPEPVAAFGPSRTAAEHVAEAERRWDTGKLVKFTGRHLLLA